MAKSKSSTAVSTTSDRKENAILKYFRETRSELKRVTWPTQEEARNLTVIITIATIVMAIFLGTFDYIFQIVVAGIIGGSIVEIIAAIVLFAAGVAAFYFNSQVD